jgi:magnesium-transporting ATPase (P-type)
MDRPPRRPDEPLLSRFVVARTVYVGVLMAAVAIALFLLAAPAAGGDGDDVAQAQTLAVTSVAFFQTIFYLLMCRTLNAPLHTIRWASNCWVFGAIAALLVLQAGVVHMPFLQTVCRTADLTLPQWLLAAAAGALVAPVVATRSGRRST